MTAFVRTPLRKLVSQVSTWNPLKPGKEGKSFEYIDLSAVDQELKVVNGARTVQCTEAPSRARQLVKEGDVLVSTVRPNLNGVAVIPPHLDGATASTGFCVVRANRNALEPRYAFHWVRSPVFVSSMMMQATGASYPAVSDRIVLDSEIPLPSLYEQRRIAAILDKADALRTKRREALAQLDQLAQSIFVEMFGDPVSNSKSWPKQRLDAITECLDRLRKPVTESERPPGDVPYYGANGQQGWIDNHLFDESLVLVAEDGGHFEDPFRGVAYRVDGKSWVNNHAHILRPKPNKLDIEYLHRTLRNFNFVPYISGTTRSKLTQGQLNSVEILVPPMPLQQQFATRIEQVARLKEKHQIAAESLKKFFVSLQARAFRGEL